MADSDPALKQRVLSAAILLPVVLALVILSVWSFALLAVVATVLLAIEWRHLIAARFDQKAGDVAAMAAGGAAMLAVLLAAAGQPELALVMTAFGVLSAALIAALVQTSPFWTGLGVLYLSLPMLALIWLRTVPGIGLSIILWLLAVVWATDIMAYFVGRGVGGPKLAPAISPGKTWSGLCGGMAGAAVIGAVMAMVTGPFRVLPSIALAAVLAVVAQIGDLAESSLKRQAGVKDSGGLIPGHGGLFDRIDGLLFAAPLLALVAMIATTQGWL